MEEKTLTISPDQGATGETASSTKNMHVGMQTSLSEEEKEAHYQKDYAEGVFGLLEEIRRQDNETCQDIIVESLFKHFAREKRGKESEKPDLLSLDRLEALFSNHLETSGSVPDWLKEEMKHA